MHSLEVLKRFLTNRSLRFSYLSEMGLLKWMPDSMYLKNKYRTLLGRKLDLDNPKSFVFRALRAIAAVTEKSSTAVCGAVL